VGPTPRTLIAARERTKPDIGLSIERVVNRQHVVPDAITDNGEEMRATPGPGRPHAQRPAAIDLGLNLRKRRCSSCFVVKVTHARKRSVEISVHITGAAGTRTAAIVTIQLAVRDSALRPSTGWIEE